MRLEIEHRFKSHQNSGQYFKIISKTLIASINIREKQLLNQPTCSSALYLDPRFNDLLDEQQKQTAISFLINIWDRLGNLRSPAQAGDQKVNAESNQDKAEEEEEEAVSQETSSEQSNSDVLNEFFQNRKKSRKLQKPAAHREIENLLLPPVKRNISIVKYWEREKYSKFYIFKIFQIVRAVSATQVTVKRLLDCFKVKAADEVRGESFPGTIDAVLMVKMNNSLLDNCLAKLMSDY
jgi:hypothetical protein